MLTIAFNTCAISSIERCIFYSSSATSTRLLTVYFICLLLSNPFCAGTEIVANLKLDEDTTIREAVLARSKFSKEKLTEGFYEGINRSDLPINNNPSESHITLF